MTKEELSIKIQEVTKDSNDTLYIMGMVDKHVQSLQTPDIGESEEYLRGLRDGENLVREQLRKQNHY
jgi:hypothetical protein